MALRVAGEPAQSLSAAFELSGSPAQGSLQLLGPLGTGLAQIHWSAQSATLQSNGQSRQFDSLDALGQELAGTPLPLAALFDWLAGRPATAPGWQVDLSRLPEGRLQAERAGAAGLAAAQLRLLLDAQPQPAQ